MTTLIGIWYVSLIKIDYIVKFSRSLLLSIQIQTSRIILLTGVHVRTTMEAHVPQDTVHRRWSVEDWTWPLWHRVSTSSEQLNTLTGGSLVCDST